MHVSLFTFTHWGRKWQPTPVFLPGESRGRGSLRGCRLWGREKVAKRQKGGRKVMRTRFLTLWVPSFFFSLVSYPLTISHRPDSPPPHWCNCIQISSLPDSQTSFPGHGPPDPTPGSFSSPVCIIGLSHLPHRAVVGLKEIRACPGVCSHLPSQPLTSESLLASHTQLPLRSGLQM